MRRTTRDRLFLALLASIIFYLAWYLINGQSHVIIDPIEEQAYIQAVSSSSPIIQNLQLCSLDQVDLLLVIISSGSHFLERQSIRETWGSISDVFNVHSQRLFIVGYQYGANLYKDLANEAQHEQDLLYLPVEDDSMTLKELQAYRWLEKVCSNVTFTFKTEDDLFVNTYLLHEIIRELKTNSDQFQGRYLYNSSLDSLFLAHINPDAQTFLFGWAFQPGKPERNTSMTPYYVSYQEYDKEFYPRYCSGK
jgi:Galactosyltransferase